MDSPSATPRRNRTPSIRTRSVEPETSASGIVVRTASAMPIMATRPPPMRSVSMPAIGMVSAAPMPCGAVSRPACRAVSPRATWKNRGSSSIEPKKAVANSSTVAAEAAKAGP